jgi:hypothetical protein
MRQSRSPPAKNRRGAKTCAEVRRDLSHNRWREAHVVGGLSQKGDRHAEKKYTLVDCAGGEYVVSAGAARLRARPKRRFQAV